MSDPTTRPRRKNRPKVQPKIIALAIVAALTLVLAGLMFTLSFDALRALAIEISVRPERAWMAPVAIDIAQAAATAVLFVLGSGEKHARGRRYCWTLATVTVLLSVAGNSYHAYQLAGRNAARIAAGEDIGFHPQAPVIAAAIAAIWPLLYLALLHLITIMIRAIAEERTDVAPVAAVVASRPVTDATPVTPIASVATIGVPAVAPVAAVVASRPVTDATPVTPIASVATIGIDAPVAADVAPVTSVTPITPDVSVASQPFTDATDATEQVSAHATKQDAAERRAAAPRPVAVLKTPTATEAAPADAPVAVDDAPVAVDDAPVAVDDAPVAPVAPVAVDDAPVAAATRTGLSQTATGLREFLAAVDLPDAVKAVATVRLDEPDLNQVQIAARLHVDKSTVSRRWGRFVEVAEKEGFTVPPLPQPMSTGTEVRELQRV